RDPEDPPQAPIHVMLLDLESGKTLWQASDIDPTGPVQFSPDNKLLGFRKRDFTLVQYEVATGKQRPWFEGPDKWWDKGLRQPRPRGVVKSAYFSPDFSSLAVHYGLLFKQP